METIKLHSRGEDVKTLQRALHLITDGIFGPLTEEAVKDFQQANGLVADGIVGEKTWHALIRGDGSSLNLSLSTKRRINEIILHCTATKEGFELTVEGIRKYHVKHRGWSDIGYHFVVYLDGTIHAGRPIDKIGAHATNHNAHSIGVCYVGGLDEDGHSKDTRTIAQKKGLRNLLVRLKQLYPNAKILGHRDTSPDKNGNGTVERSEWIKTCPCFDAVKEYQDL